VTAQAGSTSSSAVTTERAALRRQFRQRRRQFDATARAKADRKILRRIVALPAFRAAHRLGVYFAFDGEPSLASLMSVAEKYGKALYAPVITGATMHFARIRGPLSASRFGIPEPLQQSPFDVRQLDLVLTPLVAFDDQGTRIGVGRGYYDRAFAFLLPRMVWRRPRLLGIAYEFQHVPHLERSAWDVPLWGAVTENQTLRFDTPR
jgi:5-formyltetrahydrofolate cyclo-ligase